MNVLFLVAAAAAYAGRVYCGVRVFESDDGDRAWKVLLVIVPLPWIMPTAQTPDQWRYRQMGILYTFAMFSFLIFWASRR